MSILGDEEIGLQMQTVFIPPVSLNAVNLGRTSIVMKALTNYSLPSIILQVA